MGKRKSGPARKGGGGEKPLTAHGRKSLLKMVLGMAIRKYRYKPGEIRQSATANIKRDLDLEGLQLDEDTIRNWLSNAIKEIGYSRKDS